MHVADRCVSEPLGPHLYSCSHRGFGIQNPTACWIGPGPYNGLETIVFANYLSREHKYNVELTARYSSVPRHNSIASKTHIACVTMHSGHVLAVIDVGMVMVIDFSAPETEKHTPRFGLFEHIYCHPSSLFIRYHRPTPSFPSTSGCPDSSFPWPKN